MKRIDTRNIKTIEDAEKAMPGTKDVYDFVQSQIAAIIARQQGKTG